MYKVEFLIIMVSQIFSRTVGSENQEALSDWLKHASPDGMLQAMSVATSLLMNLYIEQHTVLKMLKSAEATQVNDVSMDIVISNVCCRQLDQ